jgi:hypothetical protein
MRIACGGHGVGRTDKLVSRTSICNINNRAQMMMQMAALMKVKSDLMAFNCCIKIPSKFNPHNL